MSAPALAQRITVSRAVQNAPILGRHHRTVPDTVPIPNEATPGEIAAACRVSLRTARRWHAAGRMPYGASLALSARFARALAPEAPAWRGWRIVGDAIVSPEGEEWTQGRLRAYFVNCQRLAEYARAEASGTQRDLFGR